MQSKVIFAFLHYATAGGILGVILVSLLAGFLDSAALATLLADAVGATIGAIIWGIAAVKFQLPSL